MDHALVTSVSEDDWESRPTTVPDCYPINVQGLDTTDNAEKFGSLVGEFVRQLSRLIDLEGLDGITIATDYAQALGQLNRGYTTSYMLTATNKNGVGVAMTPMVLRNGVVKSHILFRADLILPLADSEHEDFRLALHLLAHECAHVEITNRFDKCFPHTLLQKPMDNLHQHMRWRAINACWEEFAATWISATIGHDPTGGYEETFESALNSTKSTANNSVEAFRQHGDVSRVFAEVYGTYADLMRFASYLLGTMTGRGLTLKDLPRTQANLDDHWFHPFFQRLQICLEAVCKDYGKWSSRDDFETIGDLVDELVATGGLKISGDSFYIASAICAP